MSLSTVLINDLVERALSHYSTYCCAESRSSITFGLNHIVEKCTDYICECEENTFMEIIHEIFDILYIPDSRYVSDDGLCELCDALFVIRSSYQMEEDPYEGRYANYVNKEDWYETHGFTDASSPRDILEYAFTKFCMSCLIEAYESDDIYVPDTKVPVSPEKTVGWKDVSDLFLDIQTKTPNFNTMTLEKKEYFLYDISYICKLVSHRARVIYSLFAYFENDADMVARYIQDSVREMERKVYTPFFHHTEEEHKQLANSRAWIDARCHIVTSAETIQTAWRNARENPEMRLCRDMLTREFKDMTTNP